ncbi:MULTISPECIES: helix-turn-helix domain-containing protein [Streptomycetaceae]|uniref:helix-turn-helix domain-containing protein n=1 Tax=Streptomycetaceae TaxID=2062 RepID=UPI0009A23E78|nr:helix-turn-helix transcriptional regulator [Streptomyces sp. CB02056]
MLTIVGMDIAEALRDFLVSRRARLRPEEVGLPAHGVRRVAGLRREEVAALAAMSVEHYTRLERGQASRVSDAVLAAVADVLRLSPGERRYLRSLARPVGIEEAALPTDRRSNMQHVLDSMVLTPAYLVGRGGTILAWNGLAAAVFADFSRVRPDRRTVGRLVFTDPRARRLYVHWEEKARETVAYLRTEVGRWPHDPGLAREIGELSARSAVFRRLWDEQVVQETNHTKLLLACPPVGRLSLSAEALYVAGHPDEVIAVYTAVPGSDDEQALRRLARAVVPASAPASAPVSTPTADPAGT